MKPDYRYNLFGIPLYLLVYLWLKHNGSGAAEALFLFSPCLAALTAWRAGRRLEGNERLFWYRLGLGALLWGAVKSISGFRHEGFPLGEAVAYLGYSLFYLWALWALYTDQGRYKKIKKWLDFLLLTGAALLLVWPIGVKGIHPQFGLHRLVLPISLTGDLLLLLSSLLVYIDKGARRKGWMLLLSGILLVGYGNLLQGFTLSTSSASFSPVAKLGWTAGFLMIVGAAWLQLKRGESHSESPAMTLQFYVPSAAMLLVPLVLAYSIVLKGEDNHVLFIFSVPLILLAICRHLVTERDLEVRVREQERDNHRLSFLNVMADALGGALDVHGIFDRVFEKTSERMPIDGGGIFLIDHRSHDLDLVLSRGVSRDFVQALQSERLRLGEGITGTVAVTGQPYATACVLEDRAVSRGRMGLLSSEGISGFAAIPLMAWERMIGVLVLFSRNEYLFKPEEINLLVSVGKQVAVAVESRRMDREHARRNREALSLFHLAQAMTSTLELHEVLEVILDHLAEIFGVQSAWVMLYDSDKGHLELAALRGWRDGDLDLKGVVLRPGEGVSGEVFKRRVPIFVPDVAEDPRFIYKEAAARSGIRSMIGVPLIVKGKAIGMIGLYIPSLSGKNEIERDRMDLLLTFASQAAIAIENARLYRDLAAKIEELKSLQGQLIQTEKLSAIGELVSGVAHELNNPLTSVIGFAQLLMNGEKDPQNREYLAKILEEARSCSEIIRNLLTFARRHKPQRIFCGINEVVEHALKLKSYQIETDGIRIVQNLSPGLLSCWMDPHQLQQVFFNIINNAHQALAERREGADPPTLLVHSQRRGSWIVVSFEDNGPGIPSDVLPKVFEPFFTTKEVGVGTGLGLSISYGIVKEHGGEIRVETEIGKGSCFSVRLPQAVVGSATDPGVQEAGMQGKRILVVDASEVVLEMCAYVLRSSGATVEAVRSAETALEKIRQATPFDLVIVATPLADMELPSFYAAIQEKSPYLLDRLLFSAPEEMPDFSDSEEVILRSGRVPLDRPFSITEFKRAVELALTSSRTLT